MNVSIKCSRIFPSTTAMLFARRSWLLLRHQRHVSGLLQPLFPPPVQIRLASYKHTRANYQETSPNSRQSYNSSYSQSQCRIQFAKLISHALKKRVWLNLVQGRGLYIVNDEALSCKVLILSDWNILRVPVSSAD